MDTRRRTAGVQLGRERMRKLYRRTNIMYVPALLLFAVFVIYPFFDGIRIAFTNWDGFHQRYDYVGIHNFLQLFKDPNVRVALVNTLLYGFGSTLFQQILGLAYAMLLTQSFWGRTAGRTIVFMPVFISAVIMGYMWYFLLQYDGALNDIAVLLGYPKMLWLSDPGTAKSLIVAINTLQYVGYSMIIYIAGLQSIPSSYLEAAHIDGAGPWQRFSWITLPLLYPAIVSSVTLNLIGGLKLFDIIKALTGGGPGYTTHSLTTLLYSSYFGNQNAGFAAAIGLLLFCTILAFTAFTNWISKYKEVQL
jgi:raffinose/stachyose/melibiose transport system permease protein